MASREPVGEGRDGACWWPPASIKIRKENSRLLRIAISSALTEAS